MKLLTKRAVSRFLLDNLDKTFPFYNGNPRDEEGCVLCEFFKSKGKTDFIIGGSYYITGTGRKPISMPRWFKGIAQGCPTGREVLKQLL